MPVYHLFLEWLYSDDYFFCFHSYIYEVYLCIPGILTISFDFRYLNRGRNYTPLKFLTLHERVPIRTVYFCLWGIGNYVYFCLWGIGNYMHGLKIHT